VNDKPLQHDDHCWLCLNDELWFIHGILRPTPNVMKLSLWRIGLGDIDLDYQTVTLMNPDWSAYNALGVQLLREAMLQES
jgi:hypothetical protein